MVFWKLSITVPLVVAIMTLASVLVAPKVHALELVPQNTLKGSIPPVCLATDFLTLGKNSCALPLPKKPLPFTKLAEKLPEVTLTPLSLPIIPTKTPGIVPSEPLTPTFTTAQDLVPTSIPAPTATLSASTLFQLVNAYRKEINLSPLEQDSRVCSVASSRINEMPEEIFVTHQLHSGFYAKNLPYWATENLIYQHTEEEALQWWLHSPIHRSAIEGNYKYACGVCNGEVCDMIFTSFEQKIFSSLVAPKLTTLQ